MKLPQMLKPSNWLASKSQSANAQDGGEVRPKSPVRDVTPNARQHDARVNPAQHNDMRQHGAVQGQHFNPQNLVAVENPPGPRAPLVLDQNLLASMGVDEIKNLLVKIDEPGTEALLGFSFIAQRDKNPDFLQGMSLHDLKALGRELNKSVPFISSAPQNEGDRQALESQVHQDLDQLINNPLLDADSRQQLVHLKTALISRAVSLTQASGFVESHKSMLKPKQDIDQSYPRDALKNLSVSPGEPDIDQRIENAFHRHQSQYPDFFQGLTVDDYKSLISALNDTDPHTEFKPKTDQSRYELMNALSKRITLLRSSASVSSEQKTKLTHLLQALGYDAVSLTQADKYVKSLEGFQLTDLPADVLRNNLAPKLGGLDMVKLAMANKSVGQGMLANLSEEEAAKLSDQNVAFQANKSTAQETIKPTVERKFQTMRPSEMLQAVQEMEFRMPNSKNPSINRDEIKALSIIVTREDTPADVLAEIVKKTKEAKIHNHSGIFAVVSEDPLVQTNRDMRSNLERIMAHICENPNTSIDTLKSCARYSLRLSRSSGPGLDDLLQTNPKMIEYAKSKTREFVEKNPDTIRYMGEGLFLDALPGIMKVNLPLATVLVRDVVYPYAKDILAGRA